jgi:hypothetical protein
MPEYDIDEWGRRPFQLEAARIRRDLYRVLASVFASEAFNLELIDLAKDFELAEIEHGLVNVAIGTRVLLDQKKLTTTGTECGVLIPDTTTDQTLQRLTLREACNKIVHADSRSYDVDNPATPSRLEPTLHLRGSFRGREWRARLDLIRFANEVDAVARGLTSEETV